MFMILAGGAAAGLGGPGVHPARLLSPGTRMSRTSRTAASQTHDFGEDLEGEVRGKARYEIRGVVLVVRYMPDRLIRFYGNASFIGAILIFSLRSGRLHGGQQRAGVADGGMPVTEVRGGFAYHLLGVRHPAGLVEAEHGV